MTPIKTIQTQDCHYPIYYCAQHADVNRGYYFFDEEFEDIGVRRGSYGEGYFGPYPTLDDVCKAQHKHHASIDSL